MSRLAWLTTLRRRKWMVISAAVLTVGAAVFGYRLLPSFYYASVVMMPSERTLRPNGSTASIGPVDPEQRSQQIATLVEMARSRVVCDMAVRRAALPFTAPALQRLVKIERVTDAQFGLQTDLLRVGVTADSADQAVKAANAVARSFVDFYDDVSHREASSNRRFLSAQLQISRAKLDDCEKRLREFTQSKRIVSLSTQQEQAITSLAALKADRDSAEAQLSEVMGRLDETGRQASGTPRTTRTVEMTSQGSAADQLASQVAGMEKELAILRSRYTQRHPRVQSLEANLQRAREELSHVSDRMVGREVVAANPLYDAVTGDKRKLEAERKALRLKIGALDRAIDDHQADIEQYPGTDVQLERLTLEHKAAQDAYTAVMSQLNQAKMDDSLTTQTGAVQMIDPAYAAEGPFRKGPNFTQLMMAAIILGLGVGVGFALVGESLDRSIRTPGDARSLVDLPVMGVIPSLDGSFTEDEVSLMVLLEPRSPYAEAYRFLATDIISAGDGGLRTIMVVTARPDQGGTTVTCSLAITLAQAGKRVILVDANMRRPRVHQVFSLDNTRGLSDLLRSETPVTSALKATQVENLKVLCCGPIPDNPWKYIRSQRFVELISQLKEQSDFVLLDTPSAAMYADAISMSDALDGALIVIRANETPGSGEVRLIDLLRKSKVHVPGVVLNGASSDYHGYHNRQDNSPLDGNDIALAKGPDTGSRMNKRPDVGEDNNAKRARTE